MRRSAKSLIAPATRSSSPWMSMHCKVCRYLGMKDTTYTWVEQHFTYKQKRQSKINFNCECLSLMASRSHPQRMPGDGLCAPICTAGEELHSGDRYSRRLARAQMAHMLKQNEDLHFKPGIRKAISKQRDGSSTSCEGSFFATKCSRLKATAMQLCRTAFPTGRSLHGGQSGEEILAKRNRTWKVTEE